MSDTCEPDVPADGVLAAAVVEDGVFAADAVVAPNPGEDGTALAAVDGPAPADTPENVLPAIDPPDLTICSIEELPDSCRPLICLRSG